jgi:hypothetical protein
VSEINGVVMMCALRLQFRDKNMGWWYGVGDMSPQIPPNCTNLWVNLPVCNRLMPRLRHVPVSGGCEDHSELAAAFHKGIGAWSFAALCMLLWSTADKSVPNQGFLSPLLC